MKQRRGIRRIIIRAGIFLLLGAIVNIAVAWWCAFRPVNAANVWAHPAIGSYRGAELPIKFSRKDFRGRSHFNRCWWTYEFDDVIEVDAATRRGVYPWWSGCEDAVLQSQNLDLSKTRWLTEEASGWPIFSMRSWYLLQVRYPQAGYVENHGSIDLTELVSVKDRPRRVPTIPIWPGFAINTLFYAAILWLLFVAPFALRRMRRIKRGLCPACAYPVGASDLCTECGSLLPGARSVTIPS